MRNIKFLLFRFQTILFLMLLSSLIFANIAYQLNAKNLKDKNLIYNIGDVSFYKDPGIVMEKYGSMIIVFRSDEDKQTFLETVKYDPKIRILHEYKLIPACLIRATPRELLPSIERNNIHILGLFENKKLELPARVSPTISKSISTYESANAVNATYVWNKGFTGTDVTIAIIDSGIYKDHPDLAGKVIAERSFVSTIYDYEENITSPSDAIGHGTAVAGVAAGSGAGNAEKGMGIAPNAKIINAKVIHEESATLAGIIAAIEWVTLGDDGIPNTGDNEADVINMSLGGGELYYNPLNLAVDAAVSLGVVVTISAGNEGDSGIRTMSVGAPGDDTNAITVGATDLTGTKLKSYSSIGPTIYGTSKPDLVAPAGISAPKPGGGYSDGLEGTSFSSPHVAGAAALLVQFLKSEGVKKENIPGIVKVGLMKTAKPVGTTGLTYLDLAIGAGFIDIGSALEKINATLSGNESTLLEVTPARIPTGFVSGDLYFPYVSSMFLGMELAINLTVISGISGTLTVGFEGNFTTAVHINSPTTMPIQVGSNLYEFNITIRDDATLGYYTGNITLTLGALTEKVPICFYVKRPQVKALLDLKHTTWTIDMKYGQYRKFMNLLEELNVRVDIWYHSYSPLSTEVLMNYDFVFAPDVASNYSVLDSSGLFIKFEYAGFLDEEIEAFKTYIQNGGHLILIAMEPGANNMSEVNKLTSAFGINFTNKLLTLRTSITPQAQIVAGHYLVHNVESIPFFGVALEVDRSVTNLAIYNGWPVFAIHVAPSGGSLLASATNFIFDNWAFMGSYGVSSTQISQLVVNYINFIKLNLTTDITVSPEELPRGDTIEINATIAPGGETPSGVVHDAIGTETFTLTEGTNSTLTGQFSTRVAGMLGIGVRFDFATGWVDILRPVVVTPRTNQPPSITNSSELLLRINPKTNVTINFTINDDEALLASKAFVKLVANMSVTYEIEEVDNTELKVRLTILWQDLESYFQNTDKLAISLSFSVTDLDLNTQEESFILYLELLEEKPPSVPLVFITGGLLAIVVIVSIVFIAKKRKK